MEGKRGKRRDRQEIYPWATLIFYRNSGGVKMEYIEWEESDEMTISPMHMPDDFPINDLNWQAVTKYDIFGSKEKPLYKDSRGVEISHTLRQKLDGIIHPIIEKGQKKQIKNKK